MTTLYHLRRTRDGAYWRPNGEGYTDKIAEAGTFDEFYARLAVNNAYGDVEMIEAEPEEGSFILSDNLESALIRAIADAHWLGKHDTAYLKGLEANLAYLRKHRTLEVRA